MASPYTSDVDAYLLFEDIDAEKKRELKMKEMSETDALTGILNRATFAAQVDLTLHNAKPGSCYALLMLDVDGFKLVNDVFGHAAGDQSLVEIAGALRSVTRHDDLVARLGGDEFVLFLSDVPDHQAAAMKAKQICRLVRRSFGADVRISGSVGIAIAPIDGMDFHALYQKADAALYHVKGSGKDGFSFYEGDMALESSEPDRATEATKETEKGLSV